VAIKQFLSHQKLMVCNPDTNLSVVVSIAGWGPPAADKNNGVIGLSKDAFGALGFTIMDNPKNCNVQIGWVVNPDQIQIGRFDATTNNQAGATNTSQTQTVSVKTGDGGPPVKIQVPTQGMPNQYGAPDANTEGAAAAAALAYAKNQVGKWYGWGTIGPNTFDCSGLCYASYVNGAGFDSKFPRDTYSQFDDLAPLPQNPNVWLPGDLVFYEPDAAGQPNHVVLYAGNQMVYEAAQTGTQIRYTALYEGYMRAGRVTGIGTGGTPGPSTPTGTAQNPVVNSGGDGSGGGGTDPSGLPGGLTVQVGANGQPVTLDANGNPASSSFITSWSWLEQAPDMLSTLLTGYRALMNDVPFLPMVETICQASLRSFCAAPNGDFIAWFPDYFNVYNSLGTVSISDIELQDFTVNWSDLQMVTHQFTAGTYTAQSYDVNNPGGAVSVVNMMNTGGVATIDFPQILQELFHIDPNDPTFSTAGIYQRFGARPNYQSLGTIVGPEAEFWYALYLFQMNWSMQFAATVPICFMPELYPGIIMQIPSQGFQAYVQSVQHDFNLGPNGGFQTQVTICAPSEMGSPGLWGFPKAGT
jgi:cell wall-associated NlpC family hydrolase